MKRSSLALAFVIVVLGVVAARWFLQPNPQRNALRARELATHGLAAYVAGVQPGARLLVFSNPFTKRSDAAARIVEMEEAGLRGLRNGIANGGSIGAVVFPEIKAEARNNARAMDIHPESTTPLSFLIAPEAFDKLIQQHSDCTVAVSLIGLPSELEQCESWTKAGGVKFVLLLPDMRLLGGGVAVKQAMAAGKLLGLVLNKPEAPNDENPPTGTPQEEFDKRFLLVTPENLADMMRRYPHLF
jgi:hypothetical protein